jgi:phosphoribosylformylglycinamidine synthase
MAFAGGCGANIGLSEVPHDSSVDASDNAELLFSESASRFLAEVPTGNRSAFEAILQRANVSQAVIGEVTAADRLQIIGATGAQALIDLPLATLKEAWQKPLRW